MRDPKRIDVVVNALAECWRDYPDLRFGQIIDVIASYRGNKDCSDVWNMEEDKWLECIKKFREENVTRYKE